MSDFEEQIEDQEPPTQDLPKNKNLPLAYKKHCLKT